MKAGSKKKKLIDYMKKRSVPKEAKNLINSDEFKEWRVKRESLEAMEAIRSRKKELEMAKTKASEKNLDEINKELKDLEKYESKDVSIDDRIEKLETELKKLEKSLLDKLKNVTLQTFTNKNIRDAEEATKKSEEKSSTGTQFTLVTGLDVRELGTLSIGKRSSDQLASQFDLQESPLSHTQKDVYTYHRDKTHGPQACIASDEAAIGAMVRKSLYNNGKLPNILDGVLPKKYKGLLTPGGYFDLAQKIEMKGETQPRALNEAELKSLRIYLEKHIDKLNIFPQFLQNGSMQVCCAAPVFYAEPVTGEKAKIAKLLVVEQYKAMARLAVLRSRTTGEPETLNLTLVGQGKFYNPEEVMEEAMKEVAKIVKGENVQVYVHAFDNVAIQKAQRQLKAAGVTYEPITADTLKERDKKLSEEVLPKEDQQAIKSWAEKIDLKKTYAQMKGSSGGPPLHSPNLLTDFNRKRSQITDDLQNTIKECIKKPITTRGQLNDFIEKLENQINAKALKKPWRGKSTAEKTLEDLKESLVSLKVTLNISKPSIEGGEKKRKSIIL